MADVNASNVDKHESTKTIGGYTWDNLKNIIRNPSFGFNAFFVSTLKLIGINTVEQEGLPDDEKKLLRELINEEENREK